jgi:hypothetical protein
MPTIQPVPNEPVLPIDTVGDLLINALTDAGIVGIDEAVEQPIINRAFRQANWKIALWNQKRWLAYCIQDYSFIATGAMTYSVGLNQIVNINPRPNRLEYAFVRFLNGTTSPSNLPVDIQLDIIQSHEDYSRITVKSVGTLPWRIWYQPSFPIGLLFPWPVPQGGSLYEIHVGFQTVLPRFYSLQQTIIFPEEYGAALNFTLARVFRETYQLPPSPTLDSLARDAVNTIRLANQAMPTLQLPREVMGRSRAYSYQSDSLDN